jgi:hypothetical protein
MATIINNKKYMSIKKIKDSDNSAKNNKILPISSKDIYDIGRIKKLAKQTNGA